MALDVPINIATLPAIMVGPILRRLTRTKVTVFAVLSKANDVTLHVQSLDGNSVEAVQTVSPKRIGENLFVICITQSGIDVGEFQADKLYTYWLESNAWGAASPDWSDFALSSVSFPNGAPKPTFVGIPNTIDSFRVLHTSCRKAHGNKRDGLAHAIERLNHQDRPCLLLMSGDQIYADDVASPLMPRIKRIDSDLVNIDEQNIFGDLPPIAGRQEMTLDFGFTGGSSKNHLLTLGEFYALYILSWSDVLWPDNLPALADASPGEVDDDMTDEIWQKESANLLLFRSTLPTIRTVLANVPVLMIFDDHEVTDDWGLSYPWIKDVFSSPRGNRTVSNGLLAYTIFQHWGNVPEKFVTNGTPEFLTLSATQWNDTTSPIDAPMMFRLGVPTNIPDPIPDAGFNMRDINNLNIMRYDFRISPLLDGYPINIVFLDERTARFYAEADKPAGRISIDALNEMWPTPNNNEADIPTLLIAPAPILGLSIIEHVLQPLLALKDGGDEENDFEGWSALGSTFEHLLNRVGEWKKVVALSGDVHFGYTKLLEYKKPQNGPTSKMVQFVASAAKNSATKTLMLHLFGDALTKLGIVRTHSFNGYNALNNNQKDKLKVPPPTGTALPYDDLIDVLLGRVLRDGMETPAVIAKEVSDAYDLGQPDWNYSVDHIDDETQAPPGELLDAMNAVTGPGFPWDGWDREKSISMVRALRASDLHRIGRVLVGLPQLSQISFPNAAPLTTRQELYIAVGSEVNDDTAITITELELT